MGISTKTGDDGSTGLFSGERVRKDDPRVEALGAADECSARIAHALLASAGRESAGRLTRLQESLGPLMARIAGASSSPPPDADWIDSAIDAIEADFTMEGFAVLGTTEYSARLDLARVACRALERRLVAAGFPGKDLAFANRASDLLFLLARLEEKNAGTLRYR